MPAVVLKKHYFVKKSQFFKNFGVLMTNNTLFAPIFLCSYALVSNVNYKFPITTVIFTVLL